MATPPRTSLWRKRLTRAILCLLLGAATTVGVAWLAVTIWASPQSEQQAWLYQDRSSLRVIESIFWGSTGRYVEFNRRGGSADHPVVVSDDSFGAEFERLATLAAADERLLDELNWCSTALGQRMLAGGWGWLPDREVWLVDLRASGWPLRCLWGYSWSNDPLQQTDWGPHYVGLLTAPWNDRSGSVPAYLPTLPIWPGFLVNTLVYAAPWWLILVTPGALKRWRRRRRGQCVGCGYDLAGLRADENATPTCPECGA